MADKLEYDCLTCPYPRYKTPELIYCDVCIRAIMEQHKTEMEVNHGTKQSDQPKGQ